MNNVILALIYFIAWLLMVCASAFMPWSLLPDIILVCIVYQSLYLPKLPIWRFVIPISVLMDCSAGVIFGFHALMYVMVVTLIYFSWAFWHRLSHFNLRLLIIVLACGFQLFKFIIYYLLAGIPAPNGWYYVLLYQLVIWWTVRYVLMAIYHRFLYREFT